MIWDDMAAAPETARQLQSAIFLPQRKIKKWAISG
jgi:hypothetical protein